MCQNVSPNQDKSVAQEEVKVVNNKDMTSWTEEFMLISNTSNIAKWQKEISVEMDCNEFFRDEQGSNIQII